MELVEKEEKKRPSFDDYVVYAILGGVISYLVFIVFILIMMIIDWPSTLYDHFSGEWSIIDFLYMMAMGVTIVAGLYPFLLGVVGGLVGGRIKKNRLGALVGGLVSGVLTLIGYYIVSLFLWMG